MAGEDWLFPILWWSGPIGMAFFFVGLGYFIKCLAWAARKDKETKESKGKLTQFDMQFLAQFKYPFFIPCS